MVIQEYGKNFQEDKTIWTKEAQSYRLIVRIFIFLYHGYLHLYWYFWGVKELKFFYLYFCIIMYSICGGVGEKEHPEMVWPY